ncbi:MAG: hypothetical protein HY791_08060 [Deltaproteobacteria bacterium]|nr:hypothetical protein [Deltaproteobacteria bacterium]
MANSELAAAARRIKSTNRLGLAELASRVGMGEITAIRIAGAMSESVELVTALERRLKVEPLPAVRGQIEEALSSLRGLER